MDLPTTLKLISMEVGNPKFENFFRILASSRVKYIIICPGALDREALMDMPLNFANILPPLPYGQDTWNTAHISRNAATGKLEFELSAREMAGISNVWHPTLVDFLHLQKIKSMGLYVQLCTLTPDSTNDLPNSTGEKMIAKMARFEWEIRYIARETLAYQLLHGTGIGPRVLGQIHEQGRVIGILLEKVRGRRAGIGDLPQCLAALKSLHNMRILHGDCNRHNFIVGSDGEVTLIDFSEFKENATDEELLAEEGSLAGQLEDASGLGDYGVLEEDGDN
ncbi:unnamed protein product [Clonostachys rosea]|uniref:Aminoglycoside phosphotransferase domain-containing protein n=1 Tax=Bionectria ochroleuca TaxID=29856 RepID=A0ABY6UNJ8_BIOOC|nr:unnamed protein product [Clonostachys rosea]